jgi:hypothetical protein
MPADEKMTIDERLKYLRRVQKRYRQADRQTRGRLLDEMQAVTDLERKPLIRLMASTLERHPRQRQRGCTYDAGVDDALRVISQTLDHISAERLTPNLVWIAQTLAAHGELVLSPELEAQLGAISTSTVARILRRLRQDEPRLPRKGPQEANRQRREVPMRRIAWDESQPGHFEADLVFHSGPNTTGDHVHTVQLIDVTTAWSERVAVLGRGYLVMRDAFYHIMQRLPFPILEIHPDNGAEFFSRHLLAFWGERLRGVTLSRSRPWHKNDNRFVEQKNDTLVRAYLGHDRLDSVVQTRATNALYEDMWIYYNFFQPVMRLAEKEVVREAGGQTRMRRRYDEARTPFDRLCTTEVLPTEKREQLARWRDGINPRRLRQSIYDQLEALFRLPGATSGQTEDVYATLQHPEIL